jgi:hypothetical protein
MIQKLTLSPCPSQWGRSNRWAFRFAFASMGAAIAFVLLSGSFALAQSQKPQPQSDATSEGAPVRGKYIVESVAMCGDCHTPGDNGGNPDRVHWLQGAPIPWSPAKPDSELAAQRAEDRGHSPTRQRRRYGGTLDHRYLDYRQSASSSHAPVSPESRGRRSGGCIFEVFEPAALIRRNRSPKQGASGRFLRCPNLCRA